jgi:hypothetical protein
MNSVATGSKPVRGADAVDGFGYHDRFVVNLVRQVDLALVGGDGALPHHDLPHVAAGRPRARISSITELSATTPSSARTKVPGHRPLIRLSADPA